MWNKLTNKIIIVLSVLSMFVIYFSLETISNNYNELKIINSTKVHMKLNSDLTNINLLIHKQLIEQSYTKSRNDEIISRLEKLDSDIYKYLGNYSNLEYSSNILAILNKYKEVSNNIYIKYYEVISKSKTNTQPHYTYIFSNITSCLYNSELKKINNIYNDEIFEINNINMIIYSNINKKDSFQDINIIESYILGNVNKETLNLLYTQPFDSKKITKLQQFNISNFSILTNDIDIYRNDLIRVLLFNILITLMIILYSVFFIFYNVIKIKTSLNQINSKILKLINNETGIEKLNLLNQDDELAEIMNNINNYSTKISNELNRDLFVIEEIKDIVEKADNGFYYYTVKSECNNHKIEELRNVINSMVLRTRKQLETINNILLSLGRCNLRDRFKDDEDLNGILGSIFSSIILLNNNYAFLLRESSNTPKELRNENIFNNILLNHPEKRDLFGMFKDLSILLSEMINEKNNFMITLDDENQCFLFNHFESKFGEWILECESYDNNIKTHNLWTVIKNVNKDLYNSLRLYSEQSSLKVGNTVLQEHSLNIEKNYRKLINLVYELLATSS